jgi:hypothetical protein
MAKKLALLLSVPIIISAKKLKNGWDEEDFGSNYNWSDLDSSSSIDKPPDQ